jgi:RES domain-containing protein
MILWRISRFHNLSGIGSEKYPARWHMVGHRVVYTANSSAGALLEICANTTEADVPDSFTLLKIVGPETSVEDFPQASLPDDWVRQKALTQRVGSEWLASGRTALLKVPSALVPEAWNYLLNPQHPEAGGYRIERVYPYPFDRRLKS